MSERRKDAAEASMQAAFAAQVSTLNLPADSTCENDSRTIGVAFAVFKKTVDLKTAPAAAQPPGAVPSGSASDAAIGQVLRGYESLAPDQFAQHWRDFASDPHMGVGMSWVGVVDGQAVDHWLKSDSLAKAVAAFPPQSPRKVKLHDLHVTYIGDSRAAATYRVEEEHANGKKSAGNAAAILMHVDGKGWRVVVVTKGGRGEG